LRSDNEADGAFPPRHGPSSFQTGPTVARAREFTKDLRRVHFLKEDDEEVDAAAGEDAIEDDADDKNE